MKNCPLNSDYKCMTLLNEKFKVMAIVRFVVLSSLSCYFPFFPNWIYIHFKIMVMALWVQSYSFCILPQFRALSDQLYGTPDNHELVRQKVVNQVCHPILNTNLFGYPAFYHNSKSSICLFSCQQLMSHPEIYEGYVPMAYDEYLEKMSRF